MDEDRSAKCRNFLAALCELCRSHGVTLTPSLYDNLQVWDWNGEALNFNGIEDNTESS